MADNINANITTTDVKTETEVVSEADNLQNVWLQRLCHAPAADVAAISHAQETYATSWDFLCSANGVGGGVLVPCRGASVGEEAQEASDGDDWEAEMEASDRSEEITQLQAQFAEDCTVESGHGVTIISCRVVLQTLGGVTAQFWYAHTTVQYVTGLVQYVFGLASPQ
jgi:hypothetical protein